MDTSIEYIVMCKEAIELQEAWNPEQNDIHYDRFNGLIKRYNQNKTKWQQKENMIWIPRQDQLQGIIRDPKYNDIQFVDKMYNFIKYNQAENISNLCGNPSMEQLWLTLVMKEKYNKIWNSNIWI